jgi:formylglycine-generating enzyme required for sulfatase activity
MDPTEPARLYDRLLKLPSEDLANLAGVLLPPEARVHLSIRPSLAELGQVLVQMAADVPAIAKALERRLTDPVADWLACGARKYGSVRIVGFQDQYKIRLSLHDVFVSLSVQQRGRGETPEGKREGLHAAEPRRANLTEALSYAGGLPDAAGLVVLGDPGAGKTTLLYHLYTRVALGGSESMGLPEGLCPVYVRCSSLTDADRRPNGLRSVIERQAASDGYAVAGKRMVEERRPMLFLLDGLDEVRDKSTRAAVCDWLGEEVAHWAGSRFVVTCRLTAFRDEARLDTQFVRVEVEWLDPPRVREFVHRWFRAVHERLRETERPVEHAKEQAEALLAVALDPERMTNVRLREMTENPLLLSTLCLLHHSSLRLPEKRGELYDRCLSLLLDTWAAHAGRPTLPDRPSRLVLQPLAYEMHVRAARELPAGEAEKIVAAPLGRVPALKMSPKEFLEVACEQCGVLASRNIGSYEFFHLSFQEYLCAAYMKEAGLAADLAGKAGDPWWAEAILLAMSMPGMFAPFARELVRSGRVAGNVGLVRECLAETIELDEAPFVELLDEALAQAAKPKHGLGAWLSRWLGPPERDLAPDVRAVLAVAYGRELPGVVERAARLVDHPDPGFAAAARALLGRPTVEEVAAPAPQRSVWRERVTGMTFVWVPPGRFLMGSSKEEGARGFDPEAYTDELPAHEVESRTGVWIGEHPVTNAEYGVFLAATKHPPPASWQVRRYNAPAQPVVTVSFEDALAFCAWLTAQAGLQGRHMFDLPTEAEWEHAARGSDRGSDGRRYPWGNDAPTPERACFDLPVDAGAPAPVGGRPAGTSPFGCQDMAGNVWEWCLDAWRDSYGEDAALVVNPCHPGLRGAPRVVRGGSWSLGARRLRCAVRLGDDPGVRGGGLGFRVVCRGSRQPWLLES